MDTDVKVNTGVKVDVNVTKIVKYVCFAGVIIVGIVFGERAYEKYLEVKKSYL